MLGAVCLPSSLLQRKLVFILIFDELGLEGQRAVFEVQYIGADQLAVTVDARVGCAEGRHERLDRQRDQRGDFNPAVVFDKLTDFYLAKFYNRQGSCCRSGSKVYVEQEDIQLRTKSRSETIRGVCRPGGAHGFFLSI